MASVLQILVASMSLSLAQRESGKVLIQLRLDSLSTDGSTVGIAPTWLTGPFVFK
jgi:hypothetical protein